MSQNDFISLVEDAVRAGLSPPFRGTVLGYGEEAEGYFQVRIRLFDTIRQAFADTAIALPCNVAGLPGDTLEAKVRTALTSMTKELSTSLVSEALFVEHTFTVNFGPVAKLLQPGRYTVLLTTSSTPGQGQLQLLPSYDWSPGLPGLPQEEAHANPPQEVHRQDKSHPQQEATSFEAIAARIRANRSQTGGGETPTQVVYKTPLGDPSKQQAAPGEDAQGRKVESWDPTVDRNDSEWIDRTVVEIPREIQ